MTVAWWPGERSIDFLCKFSTDFSSSFFFGFDFPSTRTWLAIYELQSTELTFVLRRTETVRHRRMCLTRENRALTLLCWNGPMSHKTTAPENRFPKERLERNTCTCSGTHKQHSREQNEALDLFNGTNLEKRAGRVLAPNKQPHTRTPSTTFQLEIFSKTSALEQTKMDPCLWGPVCTGVSFWPEQLYDSNSPPRAPVSMSGRTAAGAPTIKADQRRSIHSEIYRPVDS